MPNTVLVTANLTNATKKKKDKFIPNKNICIYEDNHIDIFSRTDIKLSLGSSPLTVPALDQSVGEWPGTQMVLVWVLVRDQKTGVGSLGHMG